MTMNPFEQSTQQLLRFLTSQVEQEVIDYIRQEMQHDAPDSVPTEEELFAFFQSHLLPGIRNNPDSLSHKEQPAVLRKHTEAARIIFQNPAVIFNLHFSPAIKRHNRLAKSKI